MPQRKQEITRHIGGGLLWPEAIRFVRKNRNGCVVRESAAEIAMMMACNPRVLLAGNPGPSPKIFAELYASAPDVMAGLLAHLRRKWTMFSKSKAGRLQLFMDANPVMLHPERGPWMQASFGNVTNSGMAD